MLVKKYFFGLVLLFLVFYSPQAISGTTSYTCRDLQMTDNQMTVACLFQCYSDDGSDVMILWARVRVNCLDDDCTRAALNPADEQAAGAACHAARRDPNIEIDENADDQNRGAAAGQGQDGSPDGNSNQGSADGSRAGAQGGRPGGSPDGSGAGDPGGIPGGDPRGVQGGYVDGQGTCVEYTGVAGNPGKHCQERSDDSGEICVEYTGQFGAPGRQCIGGDEEGDPQPRPEVEGEPDQAHSISKPADYLEQPNRGRMHSDSGTQGDGDWILDPEISMPGTVSGAVDDRFATQGDAREGFRGDPFELVAGELVSSEILVVDDRPGIPIYLEAKKTGHSSWRGSYEKSIYFEVKPDASVKDIALFKTVEDLEGIIIYLFNPDSGRIKFIPDEADSGHVQEGISITKRFKAVGKPIILTAKWGKYHVPPNNTEVAHLTYEVKDNNNYTYIFNQHVPSVVELTVEGSPCPGGGGDWSVAPNDKVIAHIPVFSGAKNGGVPEDKDPNEVQHAVRALPMALENEPTTYYFLGQLMDTGEADENNGGGGTPHARSVNDSNQTVSYVSMVENKEDTQQIVGANKKYNYITMISEINDGMGNSLEFVYEFETVNGYISKMRQLIAGSGSNLETGENVLRIDYDYDFVSLTEVPVLKWFYLYNNISFMNSNDPMMRKAYFYGCEELATDNAEDLQRFQNCINRNGSQLSLLWWEEREDVGDDRATVTRRTLRPLWHVQQYCENSCADRECHTMPTKISYENRFNNPQIDTYFMMDDDGGLEGNPFIGVWTRSGIWNYTLVPRISYVSDGKGNTSVFVKNSDNPEKPYIEKILRRTQNGQEWYLSKYTVTETQGNIIDILIKDVEDRLLVLWHGRLQYLAGEDPAIRYMEASVANGSVVTSREGVVGFYWYDQNNNPRLQGTVKSGINTNNRTAYNSAEMYAFASVYEQDDLQRLLKNTRPDGVEVEYEYEDSENHMRKYDLKKITERGTDGSVRETRMSFDPYFHVLKSITYPGYDKPVEYTYCFDVSNGEEGVSARCPCGSQTSWISIKAPDGSKIERVVDQFGRTTEMKNERGLISTIHYEPVQGQRNCNPYGILK